MAKKVVYLSKTQYETLLADGTLTVGDVTITYSADDMYVVPDDYSYVTESDLEDYVAEVLGNSFNGSVEKIVSTADPFLIQRLNEEGTSVGTIVMVYDGHHTVSVQGQKVSMQAWDNETNKNTKAGISANGKTGEVSVLSNGNEIAFPTDKSGTVALKEDLGKGAQYELLAENFQKGTVYCQGGYLKYESNDICICTKEGYSIPLKKGDIIKSTGTVQYRALPQVWIDEKRAGNPPYIQGEYEVPEDDNYYFAFRLDDNTENAAVIELATVLDNFTIIKNNATLTKAKLNNEAKSVFCVMSNNVGGWYNGTGMNIPQEYASEFIACHQEILKKYKPDILACQEFQNPISEYKTAEYYFFDEYYCNVAQSRVGDAYLSMALCTSRSMEYVGDTTYTFGTGRYYQKSYITLNGRKVCVINTHMTVPSTHGEWAVEADFKELLSVVENEEYFIILGDFNIDLSNKTSNFYLNTYQKAIDKGYKLCNGGEFGDLVTYSPDNQPIDNIIVSANINIKSVMVDKTKEKYSTITGLGIDHYPLVAYLEIKQGNDGVSTNAKTGEVSVLSNGNKITFPTDKSGTVALKEDLAYIDDMRLRNVSANAFYWAVGTLNPGVGNEGASTSRLRSEYIYLEAGSVIKTNGIYMVVYFYDLNKIYIPGSETSWDKKQITVPTTGYVRILLKFDNDAAITDDNKSALLDACTISMQFWDISKESVDSLVKIEKTFIADDFVLGTLGATGGNEVSKSRSHTDYFYATKGDVVEFDNFGTNYYAGVHYYDDDKVWVSFSGWGYSNIAIPRDGYIKILVGTTDWSDITDLSVPASMVKYSSPVINKLSGVSKQVDSLMRVEKIFIADDFSSGTLNATGLPEPNNSRIHTHDYIYAVTGDVIEFDNSKLDSAAYHIIIAYYDDNKTWISSTTWTTNSVTIARDGYIRILIGTGDYSKIAEDDYTAIASMVKHSSTSAKKLSAFDKQVSATDKRVDELTEAVVTPAEKYDYSAKVAEFAALYKNTGKVDSFLYFTDPHLLSVGDTTAFYEKFKNHTEILGGFYDRTPTTFVLCNGDWLEWGDTQENALYKLGIMTGQMKKLFGENYYPAFGNHDNNYQGDKTNGDPTLDNSVMKNVMFPFQKAMYYRFEGQAGSFYVLDSGADNKHVMDDYRWEQIDWLANDLKTADKPYSAIAMHIIWNIVALHTLADNITQFATNVNAVIEAYNNRSSITLNGKTYDFTNCTGKVYFMLGGHGHIDHVDTATYAVPMVLTEAEYYGAVPTFEMVLVDWENGTLNMVRVGDGENRTINIK
jgi:endonuclease/exonuclease/phosphatase family metal-dependent hydrolase